MQKAEKIAAEAERQRKIQRTADEKCERLRPMAKRRCAAGVEGLATKTNRHLSRRKGHPLTNEQKYKNTRVDDERRSAIKLTAQQKSQKARVQAERRSAIKLTNEQKS